MKTDWSSLQRAGRHSKSSEEALILRVPLFVSGVGGRVDRLGVAGRLVLLEVLFRHGQGIQGGEREEGWCWGGRKKEGSVKTNSFSIVMRNGAKASDR